MGAWRGELEDALTALRTAIAAEESARVRDHNNETATIADSRGRMGKIAEDIQKLRRKATRYVAAPAPPGAVPIVPAAPQALLPPLETTVAAAPEEERGGESDAGHPAPAEVPPAPAPPAPPPPPPPAQV